MHTLIIILL